ncbi:uncharacterized protein [Rutidosis leptorrhynchoides]|uniref:uncharacterized protein n=1 Tax=Rutidosis leptorrhynchoides TaxID=125765 RepID=UPI003A9921E4
MGQKLKTQDKLKSWEVRQGQVLVCSLCGNCPDSYAHLFFDCSFSRDFWDKVCRSISGITSTYDWSDITASINLLPQHSASALVAKLMFAVAVYFIWRERNNILFKRKSTSTDSLFGDLVATVRLKLMLVCFKELRQVRQLHIAWNLI